MTIAIGAGLRHHQLFQPLAILRILRVFLVAAHHIGDDALEPPLVDPLRRLYIRIMPSKLPALRAVQQQIALRRRKLSDGRGRIEIEPIVLGGHVAAFRGAG